MIKPKANNESKKVDSSDKSKQQEITEAFKTIFATEAGKIVLKNIDLHAQYKEDSFNTCPYTSAYLDGRQSIAVHIHKVLENK